MEHLKSTSIKSLVKENLIYAVVAIGLLFSMYMLYQTHLEVLQAIADYSGEDIILP